MAVLCSALLTTGCDETSGGDSNRDQIEELVMNHARAWETGDAALLDSVLHDEVVFAFPGGRLNKTQMRQEIANFARDFENTKVYVHGIWVDGDAVAVEWQFATTFRQTGKRSAVSDAHIARVKDGKFVLWKEYFDPSVSAKQADGTLALEEGEEPFPWPSPL